MDEKAAVIDVVFLTSIFWMAEIGGMTLGLLLMMMLIAGALYLASEIRKKFGI